MEGGVFGDLSARQPKPVRASAQGVIPVGGASGRSQIFGPEGQALMAAEASAGGGAGATDGAPTGPYRINFDNAQIKDVIHAILGETLKVNYTISPDVGGTVTVASSQPVDRDGLLSMLEAVLAAQGFSMTKTGAVYKIGAMAPGGGSVDVGTRAEPGYGISVVPLRYVSVNTMMKLLGGFVTDAEGMRIDTTKNALVISGPGSRREDVVRTAASFDQDWMAGQTVGIFELKQATPDSIVKELSRIFDSSGSGNGVIQFQPIQRLKSILAISKNAGLVRRAGSWVQRLDQQSASQEQTIFVYRPQYRDASELAKVLSGLFGASGGNVGQSAFAANQGITSADRAAATSSGDGTTDAGTAQGADNSTGNANEQPIDDVTGASEGSGDQAAAAAGGAPDVIDLTQGSQSRQAIRISADLANNTVVTYTDAETYKQVLAALQRLDAQPYQVAIQATIAEVTLNNELNYGVQFYLKNTDLGIGETGAAGLPGAGLAASSLGSGFNFIMGTRSDPRLIVSALDKVTNVEILSSPSLVVMENQTANLQVGDDVPVEIGKTVSSGNVSQTQVEYRSTGIILKVTPRIGENGAVTMKVDQEISAVSAGSSSLNPTFSKRKVSSQISVVSGQTVVLAGLISGRKSTDRSGLPLFSRIPGLQDLAGTNGKVGKRTELVVLIKPVVIHSSDDAQTVAEELKSRMWAIGGRESGGQ